MIDIRPVQFYGVPADNSHEDERKAGTKMLRDDPNDDDEDDDSYDDFDEDELDDDDLDEPTVPCPYCRREIHEDAQRCPYCERYISAEDRPADRKPWWILIGVALCLYAVISWFL